MGARAARSLKPQPDGKKDNFKKKKTLKEVASEMKEDLRNKAFEEKRRHDEGLHQEAEQELLLMIFGPDKPGNQDI